MKWGGYNERAEEKMNQIVEKIISRKTVFMLFSLLTLGLLLGASVKWSPW